jgi:protein TonB
MLRALMASASGCITLSLALHATLLWGAARHEQTAERHVAVDLAMAPIALGFESDGALAGPDERSRSAPGAAAGDPVDATPEALTAAAPLPRPHPPRPRPVPRPEKPAPAPRPIERAPGKKEEAAAAETPAAATPGPRAPSPTRVASAAPAPAPMAPTGSGAGRVVAPAGVVSALPGSGTGTGAHAPGSGNGADGASGNGVDAARGGGSDSAAHRAALLDYSRRVRARIAEHREYPYAARRAQLHGTVCLRIEVAASGRLLDARPTCGNSLAPLARAALAAVASASPLPPLPAALGQRLTLDVPVIFELED